MSARIALDKFIEIWGVAPLDKKENDDYKTILGAFVSGWTQGEKVMESDLVALRARIAELEAGQLARMLACLGCGGVFSVNQMYSPDACSEKCQERIEKNQVAKLEANQGHYIKGGNGSHWDGCEETHWDCKIAKQDKRIAELEKESGKLVKMLELVRDYPEYGGTDKQLQLVDSVLAEFYAPSPISPDTQERKDE